MHVDLGGLDVGVAEELLDRADGLPAGAHPGTERVPKIVESNRADSGSPTCCLESASSPSSGRAGCRSPDGRIRGPRLPSSCSDVTTGPAFVLRRLSIVNPRRTLSLGRVSVRVVSIEG
jgi:hypothetical protein